MYLTQMKMNPSRTGTRRALGSEQVLHAMVLSAFPHLTATDRVLWRLDTPSRHDMLLYVVSGARPDLTGLVEQAGWPMEQTWRTSPYEPFLGRLSSGQTWRFRLTANPTVSKSRGEGMRGKVVPCRQGLEQVMWLTERAERLGVTFGRPESPSFAVTTRGTSEFAHQDAATGRRDRVKLSKATYEGVLEVRDPERLRASLAQGIGRGKAYGCGLMTLAAS